MASEAKVDTIVEVLRDRILFKEFGTAGRLPPVRTLADLYRVSREVVDRALQRLQAEGLVISYGTAGMYVNLPQARISGVIPSFDLDLEPTREPLVLINLEKPDLVTESEEVANALKIMPAFVVRRLRRQGTERATYCVSEDFYPELYAADLVGTMEQFPNFDAIKYIQQKWNVSLYQIKDDLIGRLPTLREQEWLNVVRNTPIIEVKRIGYIWDDYLQKATPMVYSRRLYVAHHIRFTYEYPAPKQE